LRFLVFGVLVLLALMLQVTLVEFIQVWGVKPDLVMVLITINGFLRGTREGAFSGFAAGLLKDMVAGDFLGVGCLSGLIAGYAAGFAESRLFKENRIIVFGLVGLTSFLGQLTSYLLLLMAGLGLPPGIAVWKILILLSTYNALIGFVIYGRYYRSVQKGLLSKGANV
jgi:rod shape-determining protein MreD